jgi:hypothetical protein
MVSCRWSTILRGLDRRIIWVEQYLVEPYDGESGGLRYVDAVSFVRFLQNIEVMR